MISDRVMTYIAAGVAAVALSFSVTQCSSAGKQRVRAEKAERLVEGVQRDLSTCKANGRGLRASLDGQNAALEELGRQAAVTVARIERERQAARKEAATAAHAARELSRVRPAGADLCARLLDVDAKVREIAG